MHTILSCDIVSEIAVSVIGHRHSSICSRWLVNLVILYVIYIVEWLLKHLGYQFHKLQKIVYSDTVSNVWLQWTFILTLGNDDTEVEVVGSEV